LPICNEERMSEQPDEIKHRQRASRPWLLRSLMPGPSGGGLPWVLATLIGVATGLGAYTFSYAKGLSYFGKDPRACTNCHIMEPQYAGWQKSSHHTVAACVDCHLPASFIAKYATKAENGYRHGKLFTTQTFEEPITVKAAGREVLQSNCERCHAGLVDGIMGESGARSAHGSVTAGGQVECVHCHWTVGHGDRAGLGGPLTASELEAADERPAQNAK
jgi:cytochrome c nitrite reductase small subunit